MLAGFPLRPAQRLPLRRATAYSVVRIVRGIPLGNRMSQRKCFAKKSRLRRQASAAASLSNRGVESL